MAQKPAAKPKPKLTDAERHKRFLEMAREVGAKESSQSFDRAFKAVTRGFSAKRKAPESGR